jgi:hypothetical protein
MWDELYRAGDRVGSTEPAMRICEAIDERSVLRDRVLETQDWRDRTALRKLNAQIDGALDRLDIQSWRTPPVTDFTTAVANHAAVRTRIVPSITNTPNQI